MMFLLLLTTGFAVTALSYMVLGVSLGLSHGLALAGGVTMLALLVLSLKVDTTIALVAYLACVILTGLIQAVTASTIIALVWMFGPMTLLAGFGLFILIRGENALSCEGEW